VEGTWRLRGGTRNVFMPHKRVYKMLKLAEVFVINIRGIYIYIG
jgi:hypothetical protein